LRAKDAVVELVLVDVEEVDDIIVVELDLVEGGEDEVVVLEEDEKVEL
jgi:hypothetical protein